MILSVENVPYARVSTILSAIGVIVSVVALNELNRKIIKKYDPFYGTFFIGDNSVYLVDCRTEETYDLTYIGIYDKSIRMIPLSYNKELGIMSIGDGIACGIITRISFLPDQMGREHHLIQEVGNQKIHTICKGMNGVAQVKLHGGNTPDEITYVPLSRFVGNYKFVSGPIVPEQIDS